MNSANSLIQRVKDSKLFLTAKGKLVDPVEWHALSLGAMPYFVAYSANVPHGRQIMWGVGVALIGAEGYKRFKKLNSDMLAEPQYVWLGITLVELAINGGVL